MSRDELPNADAVLAALIFAVDPVGCGGVVLRGMPGPARDRWLAAVRALLPENTPWRKVPVNVSDERLLGGLDFAATVSLGRPAFERGLLESADQGVLLLAMAERLPASAAAIVGAAMDRGEVCVEREGITRVRPARFGIIALDEGIDADEGVAESLTERLALYLRIDDVDDEALDALAWSGPDVVAARRRVRGVRVRKAILETLCAAAAAFGIPSARATLLALHVARIAAAMAGRRAVAEDDALLAARLVLPQRARALPGSAQPPPESAPPEQQDPGGEDRKTDTPPQDVVVEAVQAAIPPDLLGLLARGVARRRRAGGRGGAATRSLRRGRPTGVRQVDSVAGQRLDVLATLKAASPWQRLRRAGAGRRAGLLELRKGDLRVTRFEAREETTTVFVVDASGSQAAQRLAEVKGAIELLLNDCYVRRDQVALIAFRGSMAETLLAPTRALARARRSLAALPGGGGTPLASGIDAARALAESVCRAGRTPAVVLLTDGRANVARDGRAGAGPAEEDALAAARLLAADDVRTLLVDTGRRPSRRARALADALSGRYVPLPYADAAAISDTVRRGVA